ncbi:MAG: AmmeMemoRadiSam system protein A, partial [Lachnospiraceae bacterium]|nr:AmmeMemoRadiSam system protein A [Lachnospiraceae bacterium]
MSILAAYMVPHPPMIVPEVGRGSEQQIAATTRSYEKAAKEIASLRPDTIIITSPHSVMYADYFHISPGKSASGDFGRFRASQVRFHESYDAELVSGIADIARRQGFP